MKYDDVFTHGPGVVSLHGALASIFNKINQDIISFAGRQNAEDVILPSTVPLQEMRRVGYVEMFPQYLNLVSVVETSDRDLRKKLKAPDLKALSSCSKLTEFCCGTAVCLNSYPRFENQIFSEGQNVCLTSLGRAFRNEGAENEPERLREFNMREIIYLGSREFVRRGLSECRSWLEGLLEETELKGELVPAHDFFFSNENNALADFQKVNHLKEELVLNKTSEKRVAVASLNNHENHFAKAYNIKFETGSYIHSGCFGVGFERLIFLILAQYGSDQLKWPPGLKKRFGERSS